MSLSPPLVLKAGNGTKFQPISLFNIVGPFLGLTRNLGGCVTHIGWQFLQLSLWHQGWDLKLSQ
jgi:hypothetical protein